MRTFKIHQSPNTCFSGKVPEIETYAVSVHEAISRERSSHPY
ncbi:MAG: hypothetical protein ACYCSW_04990 [bacterium]